MKKRNKKFWIGLGLINLFIVATFGFLLRSKILFPLSFFDYSKLLSAHAYFALSGWMGLCLFTILIYHVLPEKSSARPFYQWVMAGVEISSLGIAASFPFKGYGALPVIFSSLYIVVSCVFAPVFIKDAARHLQMKAVKVLAIAAALALLLSSIGPLWLLYIQVTHSRNAILYRDAVYTLLHFQYNGFFTLGVFAVFFQHLQNKGFALNKRAERFALLLAVSVLPTLTLSFLWHDGVVYYAIGAVGIFLLLLAVSQFLSLCKDLRRQRIFQPPLANAFLWLSVLSFLLKTVLQTGTLLPVLGNAVYGDRPVIIGFLHLVFLGFVTLFILGFLLEENYFSGTQKNSRLPFLLFAAGIVANEIFLMLQGGLLLFNKYSQTYQWLLWAGSLLLMAGAGAIAAAFWRNYKNVDSIP